MTGFLTDLIDRSTGTAPAVRPRLPARFEPVSPSPPAVEEPSSPPVRVTAVPPVLVSAPPRREPSIMVPSAEPPVTWSERIERSVVERVTRREAVPVPSPAPSIVVVEPPARPVADALETMEPPPAPTLLVPPPFPVPPAVVTPPPTVPAPPDAKPTQAGPVVQVRIGRIDLRAVPAAERPMAAPPKPTAGRSLDDYLRSREGGR